MRDSPHYFLQAFLFKNNMKTKEELLAFINGVSETVQRGEIIDRRKELEWSVSGGDVRWHIKALWIKGVTLAPNVNNPMLQKDNTYHYEDFYFSVNTNDSPRKLCSEIVDAIDYINSNEFNED